jgi:mannose-6-phosphate isomerase
MTERLYPLMLTPVHKEHLWGGRRIAATYARTIPLERCGESWEVADRPEGMSVVANGPLAGATLHDLVVRLGASLIGRDVGPSGRFPLLIKVIDANERLSVQVHPDDASAALHGGEPKTEAWYVLGAAPGAAVYTGLTPGTDADRFAAALRAGRVESLLRKFPVSAGDAIFIPGGRVHAIGEGCLLLEVQQNSNTTWRVYDWGRVDRQTGQPRELHIEQAKRVIRWSDTGEDIPRTPRRLPQPTPNGRTEVVACPYFRLERLALRAQGTVVRAAGEGFQALFVAEGSVSIVGSGFDLAVGPGRSVLIPAALDRYALVPAHGPATVLRTEPV